MDRQIECATCKYRKLDSWNNDQNPCGFNECRKWELCDNIGCVFPNYCPKCVANMYLAYEWQNLPKGVTAEQLEQKLHHEGKVCMCRTCGKIMHKVHAGWRCHCGNYVKEGK